MYTHTRLTSSVQNRHKPARLIFIFFLHPSLWAVGTTSLSQAPVWSQAPAVPLINIRYDSIRSLNHLNRVSTKQLPLVLDELAPEATVGPNDRAASFDPGVGLSQRHTVILHEVRQAQRSWAAHTSCTVHQNRPSFTPHTVDLISHAVEIQGDRGVGHICQRDFYILHVRPVEVGELDGGVDHTGDAFRKQQAAVWCHIPSAEEEVGCYLCDAPQQTAVLRHQPWNRSGHHGATMVVVVVVVMVLEEALAARSHGEISSESRGMLIFFFFLKEKSSAAPSHSSAVEASTQVL